MTKPFGPFAAQKGSKGPFPLRTVEQIELLDYHEERATRFDVRRSRGALLAGAPHGGRRARGKDLADQLHDVLF